MNRALFGDSCVAAAVCLGFGGGCGGLEKGTVFDRAPLPFVCVDVGVTLLVDVDNTVALT